ncbi:MAG: hypothetical protein H6745_07695 [Deltaproteobacteria bacterium]|nr:hypothetical protein [Deltaproteobacteria bacterium]
MSTARRTPIALAVPAILALTLAACPDDGGGGGSDTADVTDTVAPGDTGGGDTAGDTGGDDVDTADASDGSDTADTADAADTRDTADTGGPWSWPWPAETLAIPAHASWKTTVAYPTDPFFAVPPDGELSGPRWVKFLVATGDPTRVIFQDSKTYVLHYAFASERIPAFEGLTPSAFDAVTLPNDGKRAILGAVLYAPRVAGRDEAAVQLVGSDPYDPRVVDAVMDLVRAAIVPAQDAAEPELFYFPTYEQAASVEALADDYAALGIRVDTAARWAGGDLCYADGWAIGRLVHVAGGDIAAAWTAGDLLPTDILLTDGVPAEVPHVAGIVSLTPSSPSSHVAILAHTLGIPFVHLTDAAERDAALALTGRLVALRGFAGSVGGFGACDVDLTDVEGRLDAGDLAALLRLHDPPTLDIADKAAAGALSTDAATLTAADVARYGGKASHFGLLRRTLPDNSPSPAIALSFDLWDAFLDRPVASGGTLRAAIAARLAGYAWPPDIAALDADLTAIKALITDDVTFGATEQSAVLAALEGAGFEPTAKIRFRSSTNLEDTEQFVGAGLYDSYSGCLADDTDADATGPSRCDATESKERGVFRAIQKVYASFYNLNAVLERLRYGIAESRVGMALLVHPSFPDDIELANGVATFTERGYSSHYDLVSQVGAVSVTNPDGSARPEVVTGDNYSFGRYFYPQEGSSLLPLGQHVLVWQDDYDALCDLLDAVGEAWGAPLPPSTNFVLDLEYKKVAPAGDLVVKQVRPLPLPDRTPSVGTYLLPTDAPLTLCTFQGEAGTALGNHRLKVRLALTAEGTWLAEGPDATWLSEAEAVLPDLASGETTTRSGDPTAWPGYTHRVSGDDVTDGWQEGSGAAARDLALTTQVVRLASPSGSPLVRLDDLYATLTASYATPQPEQTWEGWTTTSEDYVRLGPCPPETGTVPGEIPVHREGTVGAVTVAVDFAWPSADFGAVAGYTAPLARWIGTTITGLTTAPIVLHGYWSQTYRPQHHNFSEDFVFEPRREPGVDAQTLAELDAADVRWVHVTFGGLEPVITLISPTGKVTEL